MFHIKQMIWENLNSIFEWSNFL